MSNPESRDLAPSDKSAESKIPDLPSQQNGEFGRQNEGCEQVSSLIGRVALQSTREIDRMIDDLNKVRRRLEDEGNRLQRDLAEHSAFGQSVIQLTKMVSNRMAHVKGQSNLPRVSQIGNRTDRDPTKAETPIPAFLTALERE